jgi:hypothetical protein
LVRKSLNLFSRKGNMLIPKMKMSLMILTHQRYTNIIIRLKENREIAILHLEELRMLIRRLFIIYSAKIISS